MRFAFELVNSVNHLPVPVGWAFDSLRGMNRTKVEEG